MSIAYFASLVVLLGAGYLSPGSGFFMGNLYIYVATAIGVIFCGWVVTGCFVFGGAHYLLNRAKERCDNFIESISKKGDDD